MFQLSEQLKGLRSVAVSGHIRPDGDCVGACLALVQFIKKTCPQIVVDCYLEKPASVFSCIRYADQIKNTVEEVMNYDLFIAVDCSKDRLGFAECLFDAAKKTINIDHHISNPGTGDLIYIDPQASAASELVYDVLDKEQIDEEIAKALYIGIIHDCGVFQYSNTSKKTLQIAAELISYGFNFTKIIDETFYEKTYVQNQILGRALLESILFMDGKCVVSMVEKKTMDFYRVTSSDLDGIVSQLRHTKGVECAIFMYEQAPLTYKVSMRSSDKVDVAQIAAVFGGGGHKKAAGCMMNGTFHDNVNNLSKYIAKQLGYEA